MKKKSLKSLRLNKKSISNLHSTSGGMVPPPPPTLDKTCQGPPGHAVCPADTRDVRACVTSPLIDCTVTLVDCETLARFC
ncbi:hypothetical protein [uncultured Kordia sp.]|uniref:hypothetical protein n=1 Tax=uncultured Kordia sp. TaxID=507699 RepID=UPI002604BE0F|nr:hypothetical protein [uncultured Kordia sp.]